MKLFFRLSFLFFLVSYSFSLNVNGLYGEWAGDEGRFPLSSKTHLRLLSETRYTYTGSYYDEDGHLKDSERWRSSIVNLFGFDYGITSWLDATLRLPLVYVDYEGIEGLEGGYGDTALRLRAEPFTSVSNRFRMAVGAGIVFPTGYSDYYLITGSDAYSYPLSISTYLRTGSITTSMLVIYVPVGKIKELPDYLCMENDYKEGNHSVVAFASTFRSNWNLSFTMAFEGRYREEAENYGVKMKDSGWSLDVLPSFKAGIPNSSLYLGGGFFSTVTGKRSPANTGVFLRMELDGRLWF